MLMMLKGLSTFEGLTAVVVKPLSKEPLMVNSKPSDAQGSNEGSVYLKSGVNSKPATFPWKE